MLAMKKKCPGLAHNTRVQFVLPGCLRVCMGMLFEHLNPFQITNHSFFFFLASMGWFMDPGEKINQEPTARLTMT